MLLWSQGSWANNKRYVTFTKKLESRTNETKVSPRRELGGT